MEQEWQRVRLIWDGLHLNGLLDRGKCYMNIQYTIVKPQVHHVKIVLGKVLINWVIYWSTCLLIGMLWMIIQLISNVLLFTYRCKLSVCMGLGGGEVTIWVSHHYVWTGKICFQMHLQLVRSLRGLARIHTLLLVYIWSFILPNNSFCLACMVFYPLLGDNLSDLKFYDFVTMCMVCTNVAFSSS